MLNSVKKKKRNSEKGKKVRYAVVGLGYIAQNAVLPAFAHARVRIIRALYRSSGEHKPVKLDNTPPRKRPSTVQEISRPPVRKPELVAAEGPSSD